MMSRREYCPIACGVDVLGDRWTPLIVRELMIGARGFNEIHRGIPRASRSLLAQRLRDLERRGLVTHTASEPGRPGAYELTAAGQGLTPIVWAMGHWAAEWVFGDPGEDDCDGLSLIWRTHQFAIPANLPETRTVVHLILTGAGGAQGWLDIQRPGITVCKDDQGLAVDLALEADTAQMQRWLIGQVPPGPPRERSRPLPRPQSVGQSLSDLVRHHGVRPRSEAGRTTKDRCRGPSVRAAGDPGGGPRGGRTA